MTFQVSDAEDWKKVLGPWIQSLLPGDIVLLMAPLAAGKTTFVRAALELWGVPDAASPTYALHHRYQNKNCRVDHWDLYRLKNLDELETTSFWDILNETESISFIEWPNLIPLSNLPEDRRKFKFEILVQKNCRKVQITPL